MTHISPALVKAVKEKHKVSTSEEVNKILQDALILPNDTPTKRTRKSTTTNSTDKTE